MFKKTLLVLILGVLLISACAPAQPIESMECTTVYDYETTAETERYQSIVDQLPPVTDDNWFYGEPNAPITIVEYADFQCPACSNFAFYLKMLTEYFPNSIKVVFRHMPLPSIHDKAFLSAMVAEAAGAQGKFWEMHDLLFQYQNVWNGFTQDEFIDWALFQAEALELDVDQFAVDMFDEDLLNSIIATTEEWGEMGLNYTPFVVINDRIFSDNKPNLFSLIGIYEFGGYEECPPVVIDPQGSYTARLNTSAGEIEINLFADIAPLAVNSFIFLAENGWYDDIHFHRVLEGFVAQTGDPSGFGVIGPGYTFVNETDNNLSFNRAGILGMANAGVDTNGSQFFITLAPATNLDGSYTIFGEVTEESLAVLYDIALRNPDTASDFEDATILFGIEISY